MNIKVGHREIKDQEQLERIVPYEVAIFCIAWKQGLDRLLNKDVRLDIFQKNSGFDIRYSFQEASVKWLFHLDLYYPNSGFKQKITYIKINRFIALPTKKGSGRQVFQELLNCCHHFQELEMIRLRAIRHAVGFWEKQGFREQSHEVSWLSEDALDYDLNCLKCPAVLKKCQYIYDIKKCHCFSCISLRNL